MYQTGKKMDYLNVTSPDEPDYRKGVLMLEETCENMQKENERLVYRLHAIKKLAKRREKDVSLVKSRLDVYNDDWRVAQPEPLLKLENVNYQGFLAHSTEFLQPPTIIPTKKYSKKIAKKVAAGNSTKNSKISQMKTTKKPPAPRKKRIKVEKVRGAQSSYSLTEISWFFFPQERDPRAPKRPANPFFQFCQDRRSAVMDELNSELQPGESEPSKQELTRQLAYRWRKMNIFDKQIYVNMYETSKQKYNQEMLVYNKLKMM